MVNWLKSSKATSISELIVKKRYDEAIAAISAELDTHRKNERLRVELAHVMALAGRKAEAVTVLDGLADDLAADGFATKAIAILKKIQKLDPGRSGLDERVAELIGTAQRPAQTPWIDSSPQPELGLEIGEPAPVEVTGAGELQPPPEKAAATMPKKRPALEQLPGSGGVDTPLFRGLSREEIVAVMRGLRLHNVGPGRILVTEGEPGDSLYVLTTGLCRAYVRNPAGRNVELRELQEGAFFGEISVLTGQPRSATITTVTPCELLELDREALATIIKNHPRVNEVLKEFHARRADSTIEAAIRSMQGS